MATAKEFLQASDNSNDYADSLIEGLEQKALEDIDHLFTEPAARNPDVWEKFDAPVDVAVSEYDDVPNEDRDLDWSEGLAAVSAASLTQFFLENKEETLIKPLAYREQVVGELNVPRNQLLAAAKRGVQVEPIAGGFAEIRTIYIQDLSFLRNIPDDVLFDTLVDYGAMRTPDKMTADAMAYVARMTDHGPGSPQFKEAVADLVNRNSKRGLKGMNRRAVEQVYTYREVNGDINRLMVWVVENSPNTCSYCADRAGMVATYKQFIEDGLPGAAVCKGGDLCNCHLAAIE